MENEINPIKKVRSAVDEQAGQLAQKEFYNEPQEKHFSQVFQQFREIKNDSPVMYEDFIEKLSAKKELRDEMGPELSKVYSEVSNYDNLLGKYKNKIFTAAYEIIKKKKETPTDLPDLYKFFDEIGALINRIMAVMITEIKDNPRIKESFKDKPELLEKAIYQTRIDLPELIQNLIQGK